MWEKLNNNNSCRDQEQVNRYFFRWKIKMIRQIFEKYLPIRSFCSKITVWFVRIDNRSVFWHIDRDVVRSKIEGRNIHGGHNYLDRPVDWISIVAFDSNVSRKPRSNGVKGRKGRNSNDNRVKKGPTML